MMESREKRREEKRREGRRERGSGSTS